MYGNNKKKIDEATKEINKDRNRMIYCAELENAQDYLKNVVFPAAVFGPFGAGKTLSEMVEQLDPGLEKISELVENYTSISCGSRVQLEKIIKSLDENQKSEPVL